MRLSALLFLPENSGRIPHRFSQSYPHLKKESLSLRLFIKAFPPICVTQRFICETLRETNPPLSDPVGAD